jgi:hypothetical protein
MTSSSGVCLRALLSVLLPPKNSCCFMPRSPMPLLNALRVPIWMWALCSAGKAWWVNCLRVMTNSCWDLPTPWVLVFRWLRDPTAKVWSPNWSSVAPIVSSYVAPLRSSCRTLSQHSPRSSFLLGRHLSWSLAYLWWLPYVWIPPWLSITWVPNQLIQPIPFLTSVVAH